MLDIGLKNYSNIIYFPFCLVVTSMILCIIYLSLYVSYDIYCVFPRCKVVQFAYVLLNKVFASTFLNFLCFSIIHYT
jgi:hypothetical protein